MPREQSYLETKRAYQRRHCKVCRDPLPPGRSGWCEACKKVAGHSDGRECNQLADADPEWMAERERRVMAHEARVAADLQRLGGSA